MIPNEQNHAMVPSLTIPSPESTTQAAAPSVPESPLNNLAPTSLPVTEETNLPIDMVVVVSPKNLDMEESQELTLQLQSKLGRFASSENNNNNDDDLARKTDNLSAEDLFHAIGILNGLAAMDSSDYQSTLMGRSRIANVADNQDTLLEHPQIAKLYQNIHRLHSLVTNLTAENDHQTVELLGLHQELQAKNHRVIQLEEAVTKLHKRNTKLKAQSKSNQSKAKKMFQQVQEFTAKATKRQQEDDFSRLAMQIQHHEVILNRQRTDSNFSDLDGLQDFLPDSSSIVSDMDTHSTTSSVFDDAIATLRISRDPSETFPPPGHWSISMSEQEYPLNDVQQLQEPDSMARKQQERDSVIATPPRMLPSMQGNQNPFAKLLGPRHAQPYTLEFLEPFQLQFVALLVPLNHDDISLIHEMENENITTAFAVCGYHGFDAAQNVKPTLGARLLQINSQDVDPTWTVQELEKYIRELGPRTTMTFRHDSWSKTQKETLQMAIEEQELLHPDAMASHHHQQQQPITFVNPFNRMRSQSNDSASRPGIFGKWNFPGTNRSSGGGEKSQSITNTLKEVSQRGSVLFRSSTNSETFVTAVASETKSNLSITAESYQSSDPKDSISTPLTELPETDMDHTVSENINSDPVTPGQEIISETLV